MKNSEHKWRGDDIEDDDETGRSTEEVAGGDDNDCFVINHYYVICTSNSLLGRAVLTTDVGCTQLLLIYSYCKQFICGAKLFPGIMMSTTATFIFY